MHLDYLCRCAILLCVGRRCLICSDSEKCRLINTDLITGEFTIAELSKKYRFHRDAIVRHRDHHVATGVPLQPPPPPAPVRTQVIAAEHLSVLDFLTHVRNLLLASSTVLQEAMDGVTIGDKIKAINSQRSVLEAIVKMQLQSELVAQQANGVNEKKEIRDRLMLIVESARTPEERRWCDRVIRSVFERPDGE